MTTLFTKPALLLRPLFARMLGLEQRQNAGPASMFTLEEFDGNGATTAFDSRSGFKPYQVFDAGILQREGSSEDYTLGFDGFIWTVTFAVAPAVGDVTFNSMRVGL